MSIGVAVLLTMETFGPTGAVRADVTVPDSYGAAMRWYDRAAAAGDAEAQYLLGQRYERGLTGAPEPARAAHWYARAAEQGHAEAQFKLGTMLARGIGLPVDRSAATIWYEKAATQGLAAAQYNLGVALLNADGIARDVDSAFAWISLAAAANLEPAMALRDRLLQALPPERVDAGRRRAADLRQKYAL